MIARGRRADVLRLGDLRHGVCRSVGRQAGVLVVTAELVHHVVHDGEVGAVAFVEAAESCRSLAGLEGAAS